MLIPSLSRSFLELTIETFELGSSKYFSKALKIRTVFMSSIYEEVFDSKENDCILKYFFV